MHSRRVFLGVVAAGLSVSGCRLFRSEGSDDALAAEIARKKAADGEPKGAVESSASAVVLRDLSVAREVGSLPLQVGVSVERDSGYLLPKALRFELRQASQTVREAIGVNLGPGRFGASLELDRAGAFTLFARVDGQTGDSLNFEVWKVPSVGPEQYVVSPDAGDIVEVKPTTFFRSDRPSKEVAALVVTRWSSLEDEPAYVLELRRGGKTVHTERRRRPSPQPFIANRAFALKPMPVWLRTPLAFELPDNLGAAALEAIFHEEGKPSLRVMIPAGAPPGRLEISAAQQDTAALAAVERVKEQSEYPVSAAELRALTRSPELVKLRLELSERMREDLGRANPVKPIKGESPQALWERQRLADEKASKGAARSNAELRSERATLWKKLKPLIDTHGGPWTPEEIPFTQAR